MEKLGLLRDIDLALHLPLRYEDETRIVKLRDARDGDTVQIEAQVTACEVVSVLAVWIVYARRRTVSSEMTLLAAAAAVSALVAFDKVLSPQYLIWLVPFVLLVGRGRGFLAGALLMAFNLWRTVRGEVAEERPVGKVAPAPALAAPAQ